jgi:hypothetical protein
MVSFFVAWFEKRCSLTCHCRQLPSYLDERSLNAISNTGISCKKVIQNTPPSPMERIHYFLPIHEGPITFMPKRYGTTAKGGSIL